MFDNVSKAIVAVQSRTAHMTSGYAVGLRASNSLASSHILILVKRVVAF
jgi:hypothetical protein